MRLKLLFSLEELLWRKFPVGGGTSGIMYHFDILATIVRVVKNETFVFGVLLDNQVQVSIYLVC